MNHELIPELRADKDGKMVTRHVRADKRNALSGKSIPSPKISAAPAPRKRRAFTPNDDQLTSGMYGIAVNQPDPKNWGPHVIGEPSPELSAVPFTQRQQERFSGNWYRFDVNALEYYSVMSTVRPFDALNLLHRGIKSAEEAREFLAEHGIEHLEVDKGEYADELLRHRVNPNMGMVYMSQIADDADVDPVLFGEWVKICDQKSIRDKAMVIKDEMLSGQVTAKELKAIGIRNITPDIKAVAEYVIHSKNDGNPDFTLDTIKEVMDTYTDVYNVHKYMWERRADRWRNEEAEYKPDNEASARLAVARVTGRKSNELSGLNVGMHDYALTKMNESGSVDPERLAGLIVFASEIKRGKGNYAALEELYDSGADIAKVNDFLTTVGNSMDTDTALSAAKENVHTSVATGWL